MRETIGMLFVGAALALTACGADETVVLQNEKGRIEIALKGGRIRSWVPAGGREVFFMPEEPIAANGDWCHGGMPVCWPWFGRKDGVIHGFVRERLFTVAARKNTADCASVTLVTDVKVDEKPSFPYAAKLELVFTLTDRLSLAVRTTNTGDRPFTYSEGIHPYFSVLGYAGAKLVGVDEKPFAVVDGMDKAFARREGALTLAEPDRRLTMTARGNSHVVVWSPGTVEPPNRNLKPGDPSKFVAVGPFCSKADGAITLAPGKRHELAFEIDVTPAHMRYPYVSTYYVKPIVRAGETVKVGYYVTDWAHSKARFRDGSARFDVTMRLTCGDGKWIERRAKNVKAGDGEIEIGTLPKGMWHLSVTAFDRKAKLPSHTVWQEFRVEDEDFWKIPADKVCRVTAEDLAAYGIRGGGDVERIVPVDISQTDALKNGNDLSNGKQRDAAALKHVDAYLAAHPHVDNAQKPGYAVYVAADAKGVAVDRGFARLRLVYDKGYDREAMARQALTNSVGITRLLADKAKAGFRKIVFPKDVYRVSHKATVKLPDRTVVDFGGATLKMNGFAGCSAAQVTLPAVTDTVFENCIVEGDYYEHDYEKSENKSEWVHGWRISSCSKYCVVRNVTSKNIVGYGAINGIGNEGPGKWLTYCDTPGAGLNARMLNENCAWEPGGLRLDGTVDAADKYRFTSKNLPLDNVLPWGWLQVAKLLGYRGIRTRNWPYTIAYYDAEGKFLSAEVGFQYRVSRIPEGAKTARLSIEVADKAAADKCDMAIFLLKIPVNCVIRGCRFERCRAVGYSLESSRNFLMTGCDFSHSGECLATCAFDAEDGGDEAQDFFFRRNVFHDNPHNEFLTCSGFNFVVEDNVCSIHLYARTHSPCLRRNNCRSAGLLCGNRNRTGYWRYEDNLFREKLNLGGNNTTAKDWFNVIEGVTFPQEGADAAKLAISSGATGLFRGCTFKGVGNSIGSAEDCTFLDTKNRWCGVGWHGTWKNCRAEGGTVVLPGSTNFFEKCSFKNFTLVANWNCFDYVKDCAFEDAGFQVEVNKKTVSGLIENCTYKGKCVIPPCFKNRPEPTKK